MMIFLLVPTAASKPIYIRIALGARFTRNNARAGIFNTVRCRQNFVWSQNLTLSYDERAS